MHHGLRSKVFWTFEARSLQPRREIPLQVFELRAAAHRWFQLVQKAYFSKKWSTLNENQPMPPSSALKALRPVLGEDSLLRLGGRLQNATLEYEEKHPIILPKHRISELLIDCAYSARKYATYATPFETEVLGYWRS